MNLEVSLSKYGIGIRFSRIFYNKKTYEIWGKLMFHGVN